MSKRTMLDILLEESLLGVEEIAGSEANPRIMEYHRTTTIQATDDITPWCSSCLNWVAIQAGYVGTDSAASATWRTWGKKLEKPTKGCVIGFVRKDGSGHVGLYLEEDDSTYTIPGGNQGDMIKKSRFKKGGDRAWYFRTPKGAKNSTSFVAGTVGAVASAPLGLDVLGISYEDAISILKGSKERTEEVVNELTPIASEGILDKLLEYSPLITMAMFLYMMYDRRRRWKSDGK